MTEPISLPPGVALGIIAFLLSLLPAGFFVWFWYLRRHDRAVSASTVGLAFATGIGIVIPAFLLEDLAANVWNIFSPATSHYFAGAPLPLQSLRDALLPALGTFLVVATVEEGLRYALLRGWLKWGKNSIDQVFDGLLIGIAVGVGFATLENTLYFLNLFRVGNYDTLVFVFFLRFLVSTLAHISFSGIMGALLARDAFEYLSGRYFTYTAFFVPWFVHGLFDWLLAVNLGVYAVLSLVPPLAVLAYWAGKQESFVVHRRDGTLLAAGEVEQSQETKTVQKLLDSMSSPWNKNAPWLNRAAAYKRMNTIINNEEEQEKK